jgi:hypothetical protein
MVVLLSAWSACLLVSGCLFDRRPAADDPPSGVRTAKELRGPLEETVASPYGAHPPGPILNPDRPRRDPVQPIVYADPPVMSSGPPSPPPEPPVITVEPTPPPLNAAPAPEPDPALVGALRCLLNNNPVEALELLKQYDKTTQELLAQLLPFVARLSEGGLGRPGSEQEMNALLDLLSSLTAAVRAHAPLTLKKVCFCEHVGGFGYYEALPPNPEFRAGSGNLLGDRVTVYAEVRNFRSIPKGSNYETRLVRSVEIRAANNPKGEPQGILIPDMDKPINSHSPQQDLFLKFSFHLPPLPDGQYTLQVIVQDRTAFDGEPIAPRIARKSIDFRVGHGAGPRVAGGEGPKRRAVENKAN